MLHRSTEELRRSSIWRTRQSYNHKMQVTFNKRNLVISFLIRLEETCNLQGTFNCSALHILKCWRIFQICWSRQQNTGDLATMNIQNVSKAISFPKYSANSILHEKYLHRKGINNRTVITVQKYLLFKVQCLRATFTLSAYEVSEPMSQLLAPPWTP